MRLRLYDWSGCLVLYSLLAAAGCESADTEFQDEALERETPAETTCDYGQCPPCSDSRYSQPLAEDWHVSRYDAPPGQLVLNLDDAVNLTLTHSPTVQEVRPVINWADPDTNNLQSGTFGDKDPPPGDQPGDDNNVVWRFEAQLNIPEDGDYTFALRADDGGYIQIEGIPFDEVTGHGLIGASGEAVSPGLNCDSVLFASAHLPAGTFTLQGLCYENFGGASCEVAAARGRRHTLGQPSRDGAPSNDLTLVGVAPAIDSKLDLEVGEITSASYRLPDGGPIEDAITARWAVNYGVPIETVSAHTWSFHDPDNPSRCEYGDHAFAGTANGADDDHFATLTMAELRALRPGTRTLSVHTDDGFELELVPLDDSRPPPTITLVSGHEAFQSTPNTITFLSPTSDSATVIEVDLPQGSYVLMITGFEAGGSTSQSVFLGTGRNRQILATGKWVPGDCARQGEPPEDWELCGPGCDQPAYTPGTQEQVWCNSTNACTGRGTECNCHLVRRPAGSQDDYEYEGKPGEKRNNDNNDGIPTEYRCMCLKKK